MEERKTMGLLKTVGLSVLGLAFALAAPLQPLGAQEHSENPSTDRSPIDLRSGQVIALLNGELDAPLEDVFTDGFLAAVPPTQLYVYCAQLAAQFGRAVKIETDGPPGANRLALTITMERAIGTGAIAIDPAKGNRITELLFRSFNPLNDTPAKITADLNALPGQIGAYFGPLDGKDPVLSINADEQFAIGSTFKLYILSALARRIQAGDETWDAVSDLSLARRSFPSGMMQDWPSPAPVTLQTLATMMISISDNTATDVLMQHLGVDAVITEMIESGHSNPRLNVPFLTTRQMFALKAAGDAVMDEYREASAEEKADLLASLSESELDQEAIQSTFAGGPVALDIEWFASPEDLRKMLIHMPKGGYGVPLKIMSVNPSMVESGWTNWSRAHFKGGSEPGVLNLTWLLYDRIGRPHVLTLSWNNKDANVDNAALELIAQRILALPQ
ncbi:serine hydrolase [Erythrobacter insulae]|uniref:Serine hydrolase n=1 Tax=Erythrobacter insulae TaxID=2584124 RepID=A0A547P6X2_9SPHN|nr:serine hydrolase [Erythrobacter insulae]TRD09878.1 serine hydrolase [Erythrobacter insulae]